MRTPSEVHEAAIDAVALVRAQLAERGIDPERCPKLMAALRYGTEQAAIAANTGRDGLGEYRRFLDEVYRRLDAGVIVDDPPMIPRRTLNPRLLDPDWSPGAD